MTFLEHVLLVPLIIYLIVSAFNLIFNKGGAAQPVCKIVEKVTIGKPVQVSKHMVRETLQTINSTDHNF